MEIVEINTLDKNLLTQFEEVYTDAFPANERQPLRVILDRINHKKETLLAAFIDVELVAFALLFELQNTEYYLLDYLAIKKDHRSKGLGGEMLKKVLEFSFAKNKSILLEVDHPNNSENELQNTNRIKFYQKYGAKIIDNLIYELPDLEKKNNPTFQFLMIIQKDRTIDKISGKEIKVILEQLYYQLYEGIFDEDKLKKMKTCLHEINPLFTI
ncbi:MAG: GNAT family N-acetyltransferase [Cytophagaceae bacterium]|nr:GNAT family N-acetyltransferase [Cytophagaceae bacterium]